MSQSPSSSFNVWLLFTNIKLFDSESDFLNVARASRWQISGSKGFVLFFCFVFCRSRINVMCMCHNSSQFCCYCFCMQVSQGASLILGFSPFSMSLNFDDCNCRRKENKVRKSFNFLSISNWGPRG